MIYLEAKDSFNDEEIVLDVNVKSQILNLPFNTDIKYYLFWNSRLLLRSPTWKGASSFCKSVGAELPIIRSRKEEEELGNFIRLSTDLPFIQALYIGHQTFSEGQVRFILFCLFLSPKALYFYWWFLQLFCFQNIYWENRDPVGYQNKREFNLEKYLNKSTSYMVRFMDSEFYLEEKDVINV